MCLSKFAQSYVRDFGSVLNQRLYESIGKGHKVSFALVAGHKVLHAHIKYFIVISISYLDTKIL